MILKFAIVSTFIILTAGFSNFGCNSSNKEIKDPSVTGKNSGYFPLQAGNKWEYINEAPREETELYSVEVKDIKSEGKDMTAELSSFPFFSKAQEITKLRVKPDGEIFVFNNKTNKDELFMPSPSSLNKGYTWQFGEWKGIVGSTNDTVKTEYGAFDNCIFLNFSIFYTFSAEIWVAKDKGIVKWGYNRTNPPTLKPQYYVLNKLSLAK